MGADPPTWLLSVDPMLNELAALLVVSRPAVTPMPRCLHAVGSAPQEVQASLVDTRPSTTAPQCTTDSPPLSPVQCMLPQMGQPVVAGAERC